MLVVAFVFICIQLIQGKSLEKADGSDTRPLCLCNHNANSISSRIVGGHSAGRNDFPFACGLVKDEFHHPFCGGTLISDRHVLTAAHCFDSRTVEDFFVDVRNYDTLNRSGILVPARKLFKHPEYLPNSFPNDIAIVELEEPVWLQLPLFTLGIPTVPLANADIIFNSGDTVTAYGWGRLSFEGPHPNKLNAVELPVLDNVECQRIFRFFKIENSMICAGGAGNGKGIDRGDSGSGLVLQKDNQFVLVGVVSFFLQHGHSQILSGYTRVSSYLDWIMDTTADASCRPCISNDSSR